MSNYKQQQEKKRNVNKNKLKNKRIDSYFHGADGTRKENKPGATWIDAKGKEPKNPNPPQYLKAQPKKNEGIKAFKHIYCPYFANSHRFIHYIFVTNKADAEDEKKEPKGTKVDERWDDPNNKPGTNLTALSV